MSIWKVFSLEVKKAGEIVSIDERVAKHITRICSYKTEILSESRTSEQEYGEVSLSFNHNEDHQIHTIVNASGLLNDTQDHSFNLQLPIQENSRIQGYYRDFGKTNNEEEFTAYQVKILLECSTQQS